MHAPGVDAAIESRRSIRRFLPLEVPRAEIEDILRISSRAPSGANMQPWKVYVLQGEFLRRFVDELERIGADAAALQALAPDEYAYYPPVWNSPYLDRRRQVGGELYRLLGIARGDAAGMARQHARNFRFFDAPVGLVFTIDRALERGSWLDYGMFLQNIMISARARGLDTCPQAAFMHRHQAITGLLGLPAAEMVVCGMALGHADRAAPENQLHSPREDVAGFTRFFS